MNVRFEVTEDYRTAPVIVAEQGHYTDPAQIEFKSREDVLLFCDELSELARQVWPYRRTS